MIYFLKKISLIKQNYNTHDKKLLIIIIALKLWKIYVKKIIKIQNFYKSQKFYTFYNYEKIESTTNAIIKII